MFNILDRLEEEDFALFRTSFESGRQTPDNIRNILIVGVFGQLLFGFGIFAAADPAMHPEYNNGDVFICLFRYIHIL